MICLSSICSSMVSTANHTNMGTISSKKKMGVSPRKIILSFQNSRTFRLLSLGSVQANTVSHSSAPPCLEDADC